MKIYTRTGDDGTTGLFGGGRVAKDDPRIAAYGTIDELNASLGASRAAGLPPALDEAVARMQHELFALGAELATVDAAAHGVATLSPDSVARLERLIDELEEQLPKLRVFILPGGSPGGAALHVARCVCRRAERELFALGRVTPVRPTVLQYVNRVSDALFVMARFANAAAGVGDSPWEKT
jgi:cob(I)alamin adenosyltransferase